MYMKLRRKRIGVLGDREERERHGEEERKEN